MPRTIMISGPHGIGKTVTAGSLVRHLEHSVFMPSIAGKIAEKLGYDLNKNPKVIEVMQYQEAMLQALPCQYSSLELMDTIYDRSPLDLAVYTTMVLRDYPEYDEWLGDYVTKCIDLIIKHCDILIVPQADLSLPYDSKGNRPDFNEDQIRYREDYQDLMDALVDHVSQSILVIDVPLDKQYQDRVDYILERLTV